MVRLKTEIRLNFRPILEKDATADFDCGVESLNSFLKDHAFINQMRRLSATIVACEQENPQQKIIGFYSLSPAQISAESFPKKMSRSLPQYPIPAFRLCRLAVDHKFQQMKCGTELLVHALAKCYQQSQTIGGYCVLVDAIDEKVKTFYEKRGFIPSIIEPNTLFISMKNIQTLIEIV